jgi:hypothetical protein
MSAPTSDSAGIRQTIRALRAAGWELDYVWDGEERISVKNEGEAIREITNLDQAHLYFKVGEFYGWVFFVLGNAPYEVINDHTTNLSAVIDPMTERWFDAL